MVINTQAFASRGADAKRIYFELDQFGTRRPIDIIAETNPILIIDELQAVDGPVALKSMQEFKPCLLFGTQQRIKRIITKYSD